MSDSRREPLRSETQIFKPFDPDALPGDGEEVNLFDEAAPADDDTPTVISKNPPPAAPSEGTAEALRGRKLAHFELLDAIGVGGMAAVLRARDTQLDRLVALKILPPDMARDEENVRRFHQEARAAARLDHENIARVFYCGEDQRLHFIAFEYVEGENLRTILERRGRLPVAEAVHYVLQVAAGLAHAHRRGVVHRDIKPSNIIITPGGRAKLVDMGLARSLDPRKDPQLTQSGVTLGTFDYISPEQALEPRDADARSDIYSLGCTFYHMLTGQPPVPEGTAAKKLHHHQHVKPDDPRTLVPDLPDDVAVVLGRMMAKRAQDRYQTTEELVRHLLAVARKLGAAPDVPEGVLTVEASFPNPPPRRPVFLAALAVAAVVALVLVLGPGEEGAPEPPGANQPAATDAAVPPPVPVANPPRKDGAPPDRAPDAPSPAPLVRAEEPPPVYDAEPPTLPSLAQFLADNADKDRVEVVLTGDLDLRLSSNADRGLTLRARSQVVLRAKEPGRFRPTIRLTQAGAGRGPWAAVTIESPKSRVEGIRVLVDAGSAVEMAGLVLRGAGEHRVERCEFIQAQPPSGDRGRLASVVLDPSGSRAAPRLFLSECAFLGFRELSTEQVAGVAGSEALVLDRPDAGQDAVVRRGPARVEAVNCAFAPHAAAFRLEGFAADPPPLVVERCTVLVGPRSAVFHLGPNAAAALEVSRSLFAGADDRAPSDMPDMPTEAGCALIRQAEARNDAVRFTGRDNRYFHLDAYWPDAPSRAAEWDDFQRDFETRSLQLAESPWPGARSPLGSLRDYRLPAPGDLDRRRGDEQVLAAFRARGDLRELRLTDNGQAVAGVERLNGQALLAKLPDLDRKPEPVASRERLVDPSLSAEDPANGRYRGLAQAFVDAQPGETIVIKADGPVVLDQPLRPTKKGAGELTVKAHPRSRPVLTLGDLPDREPSLFVIYEGWRLRLEGLELRLRPVRSGQNKSQAVVSLIGGGQATLKDCTVTLDRDGRDTALALAALPDPSGQMMQKAAAAPRLVLDNCFVRGDGDLLTSKSGVPFQFEAGNTLAVLTGSLVRIEATGEAPPVAEASAVRLTKVTAYLGGHLLRLRAGKDLRGVVPIKCAPSECLFVAAAGRALIHLEGADAKEKALRERLLWEGGGNAYCRITDVLDQRPEGAEMAQPPLMQQQWRDFSGESSAARFSPVVKFAEPPPDEPAFARAHPAGFKPEDPAGYGADVSQLKPPAGSQR